MKNLMPRTIATLVLLLICTAVAGCGANRPAADAASARRSPDAPAARGVIATVHPLATAAGEAAYRRGGNAVDAAVAAALTLGVVDGHNSGIGGGCFVLIRSADGTLVAIDGRETAPAAAARDMFVRDGTVVPGASTTGALAIGVPGSVAAYDEALRHGRLGLRDLILPAADVADRGFALDAHYARRLAGEAADLSKFASSASIFLDARGKPWPAGHVLRQPDLARSYRAIAENGPGWFYGGPFAAAVDEWMRANGGVATAADFAGYQIRVREPLVGTYRGYTLVGFPPPSSGGVHVQQILNLLEKFDLASLERESPATRLHVTAEAMKLAFADRAFWLGDPDFTRVPRGLVDKGYAASLAERIDPQGASPVPAHGQPPRHAQDVFGESRPGGDPADGKHTTHIAAADDEGNWVAITATVNTTFGSKVVIPGTGVIMNNQMDDFSIQPGVPNAFGLVGGEGNAVAPGKRPLSSMSPTIVLKDGRPVLALGAAGGPTIISQVVQTLINHLDLGLPLAEAVATKRIHHQWRPDAIVVEEGLDPAVVESLRQRGHIVVTRGSMGVTQAVGRSEGKLQSVHDPRVPGRSGEQLIGVRSE